MDLSAFLDLVPQNVALSAAGVIIACKILTVIWRPPSESSRFRWLYRIINAIALNIGWATNRLGHDMTSSSKK